MPHVSERQRLLGEIIDILAVAILEEDDEEELHDLGCDDMELPSSTEELTALLVLVESRRYLEGHARLPMSIEFRESGFQSLSPKQFRQMTRVSHTSFLRIVSDIENHGIFQNNSACGQAPVWLQLVVALDRLGNYGNGGEPKSYGGLAKVHALFTPLEFFSHRRTLLQNNAGRLSTSHRMAQKGFRGCVGFIDGTTFPLSQKAAVNGECYFDRKHRYSFAMTVGELLRFTPDGQVPVLTVPSLKEIRIQIGKKEDVERITLWLTGSVVLHNMLIDFADEWTEEYESDGESESDDDESQTNIHTDEDDFVFRRELKRRTTRKAREYGGIIWARDQREYA
ncbi:Hypothetical protein PHPALM_6335 [Phytophthora palmivora]|uniref:DDE Tnp4 domain-containing protein n=1 Tax=Phytophthora palmivora TaxID=4796 RepID=A0A2P4YF47_9STRA|nr:Hypothetical protein PHPALM_6335 [Phytophthora palmivora]